jgi:cytoskeleton protein RodZ
MSSAHTLGTYLRLRRERSGLSVEAVSAGSRIVPRLVDALEADRQDLLPAPVYVRGFIRAYCAQIGADPEEALRLYEERVGPPPPLAVQPPVPPTLAIPPPRRWGSLAASTLLLVALGAAGIFTLGRRHPSAAHPTDWTATASRAPTVPVPSVSTAIASVPSAPVPVERVLVLRAVESTWVRVTPDGGEPTEETLAPGSVREWRSAGRFRVTLGNAGGVEVRLDGQALPALGERGRVVRDVIVPSEAQP